MRTQLTLRFSKIAGYALGAGREPKDFRSHCAERKDTIRQAGNCNSPRHSPDGAGRLILDEHSTAMPADGTASVKTIGAHSRQHHGKHAGVVDFDRGAEEHIDGGAAMVLRGTLGEMDGGRHATVQAGED